MQTIEINTNIEETECVSCKTRSTLDLNECTNSQFAHGSMLVESLHVSFCDGIAIWDCLQCGMQNEHLFDVE